MVEKKKELASKCGALEEEVRIGGGIKQEAHRLEQRCQQLQASNTALKRQLTALQQQHSESKATTEQVSTLLLTLLCYSVYTLKSGVESQL